MKRIARVFDPNLLFRIFPSAIFALAILMASRSLAQSPPPFPGGPPHVVLENPAPGTVPQFPSFSEQPTTQEIIRAKVFEEPFVPVWGDPSPDENKAFARAIIAFGNRSKRDDFSALTQFLNSPSCINWYPSLLFSLGWEYYHTGYFSKAIDAWVGELPSINSADTLDAKGSVALATLETIARPQAEFSNSQTPAGSECTRALRRALESRALRCASKKRWGPLPLG